MPRWSAPRSGRPAACRSPATNPSHTATRCSAPSPTGRPVSPATRSGADCAATLACLRRWACRSTPRRRQRRNRPAAACDGLPRRRGPSTPPIPGRRCGCWPASLAAHPFRTVIIGDASLTAPPDATRHRPADPRWARAFDVRRRPAAADHRRGRACRASPIEPDVPSAQVKSGVLLAGLHAAGRTVVIEPAADTGSYGAGARPRSA